MTSTTNDSIITSRLSVRFSHLTFSTFITTYYLTTTYTELKISIHALQTNDTDFYHKYQLSRNLPNFIAMWWEAFMVATVIPIILNDISYLTVSLVRRPITASRILLNTAKFLQILILLVIETNYKANLEKKLEKQCRRPEIIFMT